ncbi:MAG TPA: aminopeptidase P N-terminal domain-containing protein [Gemmatimonadaceae bacterium]|nr:aminopeptidase P N-terminal domain-containing protein [Gemmatimonadaceae bacterium]
MSRSSSHRASLFVTLMLALPLCAPPLRAQITAAEYAARRDSLAARLDSGIVIAFGGRTPVTDFGPFYQLPGFRYLTGYGEPDAALVIVVNGGRAQSTLFVTPANPRMAFYYGFRPDSTTIASSLRLTARPVASMTMVVDSIVAAQPALPVYALADIEDADFTRQDSLTRGQEWMKSFAARHSGVAIHDARAVVDELRARKSAAELALIRRAAEISAQGHRAVMLAPEPRSEYEIAATLEYTFKRLGGDRPAYGSIVGAGLNSTQLHYMKDTAAARPGDLVVMDAATEYQGYAADITRTIPVSGTFTPAQRAIYQLVRDAQAAAERMVAPGKSADAAQDSSFAVRARGLAALGLIDSVNARIDPPWPANCERNPTPCTQAYLWMIHGISHGLGLAVHDPAQFYSDEGTYQPGDAFTIEPGIYISSRSLDALPNTPRNRAWIARVRPVVAKYENTGVRIEDDYIVTRTGVERISSGVPREIDEIEALMRKRPARVTP